MFHSCNLFGKSCFIGSAICILSLLCTIVLGLFDKRAQRRASNEKINPKDVFKKEEFPWTYWLVVTICVTYYVTVIPFVGFATYVTIIINDIVYNLAWLHPVYIYSSLFVLVMYLKCMSIGKNLTSHAKRSLPTFALCLLCMCFFTWNPPW